MKCDSSYLGPVAVERLAGSLQGLFQHEGDRREDELILILHRGKKKLLCFHHTVGLWNFPDSEAGDHQIIRNFRRPCLFCLLHLVLKGTVHQNYVISVGCLHTAWSQTRFNFCVKLSFKWSDDVTGLNWDPASCFSLIIIIISLQVN